MTIQEKIQKPLTPPEYQVTFGEFIGIGPNGNHISQRFINCTERHALGVENAVPRVDADADSDSKVVGGFGHYNAVTVSVANCANKWSHHGCTANLVVVTMNDIGLTGNVWMTE